MVYMLMHENDKVAIFEIDSEYNLLRADSSNDDKINRLLPVGVVDKASLKNWIAGRGVPVTRKGIKDEIRRIGKNSTFEWMLLNNGVSLTDHYWVRRIDDIAPWEKINPYENDFSNIFTLDISKDMYGGTVFTPSASLKGDLEKKWVIDKNGVRRLVKGNYNDGCRQSIAEVFATKIHAAQGRFEMTPYSLVKIKSGDKYVNGCECPCFTSIDTEFVPAIDILNAYKKPNDVSYYEWFIRICIEHNIDVRFFMEYQIMSDFVLTNQDRHMNNFGIIRNSKTLKWLYMAPIFDSGNSLFYKSSYIPIDKDLLKMETNSFLSKEVQLLKYVTDRNLFDISKALDDNELMELLKNDSTCSHETNNRIISAYNKKLEYLNDFRNGMNIWERKYKG